MNFEKYKNNKPYKHNSTDEDIKAYREESGRLHELFIADLFAEYGVTDNPKADKCFYLAWQHGHSSGLEEVANYFNEFVELIK